MGGRLVTKGSPLSARPGPQPDLPGRATALPGLGVRFALSGEGRPAPYINLFGFFGLQEYEPASHGVCKDRHVRYTYHSFSSPRRHFNSSRSPSRGRSRERSEESSILWHLNVVIVFSHIVGLHNHIRLSGYDISYHYDVSENR